MFSLTYIPLNCKVNKIDGNQGFLLEMISAVKGREQSLEQQLLFPWEQYCIRKICLHHFQRRNNVFCQNHIKDSFTTKFSPQNEKQGLTRKQENTSYCQDTILEIY